MANERKALFAAIRRGPGHNPNHLLEIIDKGAHRHFRQFRSIPRRNNATFFSPCGTTLDRGRVQLYRVGKTYYDYLGIKADPITDGTLLPWQAGATRGTIWVVSHRHREAFDLADLKLMDGLADFAAIAVENRFHSRTSQTQEKMPGYRKETL